MLRATTSNHGNGSLGTSSSRRHATRNVSATTSCTPSGSVCRDAYASTRRAYDSHNWENRCSSGDGDNLTPRNVRHELRLTPVSKELGSQDAEQITVTMPARVDSEAGHRRALISTTKTPARCRPGRSGESGDHAASGNAPGTHFGVAGSTLS